MSTAYQTSGSLAGHTGIVVTASDRCFAGTQTDLSGPAVAAVLSGAGLSVLELVILPDDLDQLTLGLRAAAARADLIATTGGTGLAARDVTPEATASVCDRLVPGLAELMRRAGERDTPFAVLSRAICGISGKTLLVNLPGSPSGAESSLRSILGLLPHALDLLAGHTDHGSVSKSEP